MKRLARQAWAAPRAIAVLPVHLYRLLVSPLLPPRCRFQPTCSRYAIDAIAARGVIRGTMLALWRIARCNPWSAGGIDQPPVRRTPIH